MNTVVTSNFDNKLVSIPKSFASIDNVKITCARVTVSSSDLFCNYLNKMDGIHN